MSSVENVSLEEEMQQVEFSFRTLVLTGNGCGNGGPCPTVYERSDGKIAVQGYKITDEERRILGMPEGEDAVLMPAEFLQKVISELKER